MTHSHQRPPPARRDTSFDDAAARLLESFGDGGDSSSDDLRVVLGAVARFLGGLGLADHEAEELAQETVVEAFGRPAGSAPIVRPGAFLFWTARNRALDARRRARVHSEAMLELGALEVAGLYTPEDDAVAAMLDRNATADLLEHAMRAASAADDVLAVRVTGAWLELAEELGEAPTSRAVGERAGVSHTSVNQALRRLRGYFPDADARSSSG